MMTSGSRKSVRLAGLPRSCPCHACAFVRNEEEYRVLLPYEKEGLERGDQMRQQDELVREIKS
jgi:hypothetical protein